MLHLAFDTSYSSSISTLKHLSIFSVICLTKISEVNVVFRVANANANAAPQLKWITPVLILEQGWMEKNLNRLRLFTATFDLLTHAGASLKEIDPPTPHHTQRFSLFSLFSLFCPDPSTLVRRVPWLQDTLRAMATSHQSPSPW